MYNRKYSFNFKFVEIKKYSISYKINSFWVV